MFTGIVQGKGRVVSIVDGDAIRTLVIDLPNVEGLKLGASVAINGVCLTAANIEGSTVHFDVIQETLQRTSIGELEPQSEVNVERSLSFGDEIGGHLLSGHIMGTGLVHAADSLGEGMNLKILVPREMRKFVLEKGYIGVDGISLTVGEVVDGTFSLHIIPETLRLTTLAQRSVGDAVNLEIDSTTQTIVSTVERYLSRPQES
jgi:riboflavin synthase